MLIQPYFQLSSSLDITAVSMLSHNIIDEDPALPRVYPEYIYICLNPRNALTAYNTGLHTTLDFYSFTLLHFYLKIQKKFHASKYALFASGCKAVLKTTQNLEVFHLLNMQNP